MDPRSETRPMLMAAELSLCWLKYSHALLSQVNSSEEDGDGIKVKNRCLVLCWVWLGCPHRWRNSCYASAASSPTLSPGLVNAVFVWTSPDGPSLQLLHQRAASWHICCLRFEPVTCLLCFSPTFSTFMYDFYRQDFQRSPLLKLASALSLSVPNQTIFSLLW